MALAVMRHGVCLALTKTGNVIETPEQKGHFVEPKPFSASPAFFST
jgi:hypothetical protein